MAACLNTSTATLRIVPRWFRRDSISSYHYQLELSGREMTEVPYDGVTSDVIRMPNCTNASYCTGQTGMKRKPFAGDGRDGLCGRCGIILLAGT
jgi:hypothetical protein